ncbi:MAG: hypothetical protein CMP11_02950 [Zetaproteobacteria bacterium]|nr:hypothetical protein [Pseudobdellovibrionaceae bacterium]|tara:strand:+ start:70 stop:678 length:609 start_codon:yes stop_codon:yes gene_type:complete
MRKHLYVFLYFIFLVVNFRSVVASEEEDSSEIFFDAQSELVEDYQDPFHESSGFTDFETNTCPAKPHENIKKFIIEQLNSAGNLQIQSIRFVSFFLKDMGEYTIGGKIRYGCNLEKRELDNSILLSYEAMYSNLKIYGNTESGLNPKFTISKINSIFPGCQIITSMDQFKNPQLTVLLGPDFTFGVDIKLGIELTFHSPSHS